MDPAVLEQLILREIRKEPAISRRDLAEKLAVARSTAGRRVDSLIERGFLEETGHETRSEAGRPRRFLGLRSDVGSFLGFDFDARYVYAVETDFDLRAVAKIRLRIPTPAKKDQVIGILASLLTKGPESWNPGPLLGYGFGIPGRVLREYQIALSYPYIQGWEEVDLPAELGLPREQAVIENNTRSIAFGEYSLGNPTATEHLLCINVRTGISAAVISEGRLLRGHHEMAGEIRGWKDSMPPGSRNLEEIATVQRALDEGFESWNEFVSLCQDNDSDANELLSELIAHHADALSRLIQLTDPERVAIAGEFEKLGSDYLEPLRSATSESLTGHYFTTPPIDFVAHGEFSGAMGAAALSAHHFLPREID